jgi:hypothetical protein
VAPARVARHVDRARALGDELVAQAREVVAEDAAALREQHVEVPRLRDALAGVRAVTETIALD